MYLKNSIVMVRYDDFERNNQAVISHLFNSLKKTQFSNSSDTE